MGLAFGRAVGRNPVTVRLPIPLAAAVIWGIERVAALGGRASVVSYDRLDEFRAPAWLMSVERAAQQLGWRAAHDVDAGARATAAWYAERDML
jgi:nucleoside-diphosphate-sugar epimerase